MIPSKTIVREEIKSNNQEFLKKLKKYDENWHNGETFIKYEAEFQEIEDIRYSQLKTIISEKDCYIYDEILQREDKPFLYLWLWNDTIQKIWVTMIYLENNKVVQQIRNLSYQQFSNEVENDDDSIKLEETADTTIIKMSFLDFINDINNSEENEFNVKQEVKQSWWKKYGEIIIDGIIFLAAWCAIPIIGNLVIGPLLVGVVSATIATWLPFATAGLIIGSIVIAFNKYESKIKKWFFPNWKSQDEINLEKKLQEQKQILEKEHQKELFSYLIPAAKQEKILNSFQQLWERNKGKDYETLEQELTKKFAENKKVIAKLEFAKTYQQKIEQWHQNWQEQLQFSKSLKPNDIKAIEQNLLKNKTNFYQPKELWEEFQKRKIENNNKYDNLKADIREKSPIKTMRKMNLI